MDHQPIRPESMTAINPTDNPTKLSDFYLFEEGNPALSDGARLPFKSECPQDKKVKVEDLFKFRRARGDLQVSIVAACIAVFFLVTFSTYGGWDTRKLPDDVSAFVAYQFGWIEIEGRVTRLGRILKQAWVVPMLCLMVLVPTALLNLRSSYNEHQWRRRFQQPTSAKFEFAKYLAALEYVVYFILYTIAVPYLGYLVSTIILGCYLPLRLGYRTPRWVLISFTTSFLSVVLFRTFLQIKTPGNIWLYDQLPIAQKAFMLTYF